MEKHKKGKRVKPSQAQEASELLKTKSVAAVGRITGISKSKLYLIRNNPPPFVPGKRLPATPHQQGLYERCQLRSEEYPHGDHVWMEEDQFAGESYMINHLPDEERPALPDDERKVGFMPHGWRSSTTTRTCWFCLHTTEPVSRWSAVDPLVDVFR